MTNNSSQVPTHTHSRSPQLSNTTQAAGALRRLGALLYDTLLAIGIAAVTIAVLMLITFPFLPSARDHMLVASEIGPIAYFYRMGAIAVVTLYVGYCWTHKGRTLGMQVWRIRLETFDGVLPSWRDALLRMAFATALWLVPVILLTIAEQFTSEALRWLGIAALLLPVANYFAAAFDAQHRSWHDRFLQTRIVRSQ
jgi:uncharacterized RDD family membrane protein YckC